MPRSLRDDDFEIPEIGMDFCPACDGSGVEVFGITVYEPGCCFSHDSTDERPCRLCDGSGLADRKYEPDSPPYPVKMNDEDLPF